MKKVLAFDIGGTNTRLALVNENFEIEKVSIRPTPLNDKDAFLANIFSLMEEFPLNDVISVGMGVPGVVDIPNSRIIILPNVGIGNIELGKIFKEKYNLDLYLRNDAQVACLAEATLGKGKDYDRVFFVTISTGLGGSLCVDGIIQDYLTEVGHTLFKYKDSYQEFELAGGTNIHKLAKMNGSTITNAKDMFEGAKSGNKEALNLLKEWKYIITSYFKLMNDSYMPDIFVVTGGMMKSKDLFFEDIIKAVPETPVEECYFFEQAGLMGSAVYAFQQAK